MQRDISHFAGSKLQGGWSASDFAKHLTKDNIQTLLLRFDKLEPLVRVRLLLSVLALDKSAKAALQPGLQDLIQAAKEDKDEWVNITARALCGFEGPLELEPVLANSATVRKTVTDIEQRLESGETSGFRPLEEAYMSTHESSSGQELLPEHNHFRPREGGATGLPDLTLRAAMTASAQPMAAARIKSSPSSPGHALSAHQRSLDSGHPSDAATQSTSGIAARPAAGVEEMFRSSRPSLPSASRQLSMASQGHQERRKDARPRNIKLLGVDEVKRLGRQPPAASPDYSSPAANGHAELGLQDDEPEEGELEAGELAADESEDSHPTKKQRSFLQNRSVMS